MFRLMSRSIRVKAVVLDWAGTTVDYGCFAPVYALQNLFRSNNIDLSLEEANADMGLAKIDHLRKILHKERITNQFQSLQGRPPCEDDVVALYGNLEKFILEQIPQYSVPITGVLPAVAKLRESGIKIGTTTGYTRPMLDLVAGIAETHGYKPDFAIASSQVPAGRPYPWMMIKVQEALDVYPPQSMIKVGDTVVDIQEGKNFGCWSIGILEGGNALGLTEEQVKNLPKEELEAKKEKVRQLFIRAGADLVIERIGSLPEAVTEINQRLEKGESPVLL